MKPDPRMPVGLYRLHWVSGGSSLAAVGQLYDGTLWYAPTNWTSPDKSGVTSTEWGTVARAQLLVLQSREDSEPQEANALEVLGPFSPPDDGRPPWA